MIKSASLRVYVPEAVPSREPVPGFVRSYGLLAADDGEIDRVVDWDGQRLVCPSNMRLRVLESTVAFANAFRGMGIGLVPEDAALAADRELKSYHRANPDHRSHVLTSAWHVPVRWFILFTPAEKQLYEGPNGMRLRFRTSIADALERSRSALEVLAQLGVFQAPAEELAELIEWLEPWEEGSMVELDYGEVSELFDANEILFDDTCDLVHQSLDALRVGDMAAAGEGYGRVVSRWAHAFSLSFSN